MSLTAPGRWIADQRGEGRAVRVSAHAEAGFLVVSTWKAGVCVSTVRLLPPEAAELVASVAEGLSRLSQLQETPDDRDLDARLSAVERQLALVTTEGEPRADRAAGNGDPAAAGRRWRMPLRTRDDRPAD